MSPRVWATLGTAVLVLGGVTGCGSSDPKNGVPAEPRNSRAASPENTYQEIISVKKEATTILTEIKDQASAESTLPKMEKIADRYAALTGQMKAFNLSPDESEKLIDKYWKQEGAAGDDLVRAATAAQKRAPGYASRIEAILGRFGIARTTIEGGVGK
jgi:hypothetical protein